MNRKDIDNLKKFRNILIHSKSGDLTYPDDRVFITFLHNDFPVQCQRIIDRIKLWDRKKAEAFLSNKWHKFHKKSYIQSFGIDEWNDYVEREKLRYIKEGKIEQHPKIYQKIIL